MPEIRHMKKFGEISLTMAFKRQPAKQKDGGLRYACTGRTSSQAPSIQLTGRQQNNKSERSAISYYQQEQALSLKQA